MIMTDQQKQEMLEAAKQMPAEAMVQFSSTIKKFFDEEKIPINEDTLRAALVMCNLIFSGLPPVYSQFVMSSILLITRMIDEQKTGLITSPLQVNKK